MKFHSLTERSSPRSFIFHYKFCSFLKEKKYLLNLYFFLSGGRVTVRRPGDAEHGPQLSGQAGAA